MRLHSLLSPKCRVARSEISGSGVFAAEPLAAGELVAIWGGKVYTMAEVERLSEVIPHFATHTISVYPGYYFGSENLFELDDAELFNHSCDANVGVRGQVVVVARRSISAGEELTFDYDTTEIVADPFECFCGSPLCRHIINGSGWRDPAFVERNREYLSWYILELLNQELRSPTPEESQGTGM